MYLIASSYTLCSKVRFRCLCSSGKTEGDLPGPDGKLGGAGHLSQVSSLRHQTSRNSSGSFLEEKVSSSHLTPPESADCFLFSHFSIFNDTLEKMFILY